jgi:hypothetical protein
MTIENKFDKEKQRIIVEGSEATTITLTLPPSIHAQVNPDKKGYDGIHPPKLDDGITIIKDYPNKFGYKN